MAEDIFVGSVAVGVVPDARGWNDRLRDQIVPDSKKTGDEAGRALGDAIADKMTTAGQDSATRFATSFKEKLRQALDNLPYADINTYGTEDALEKIREIRAKLEELGRVEIIGKDKAIADIDLIMLKIQELRAVADKGVDIPIRAETSRVMSDLQSLRAAAEKGTISIGTVTAASAIRTTEAAAAAAPGATKSIAETVVSEVSKTAKGSTVVTEDLTKAVANSMTGGVRTVGADLTKAIAKTFVGGSGVIPAGGVSKVIANSLKQPISEEMRVMVDAIKAQTKVTKDVVDISKAASSVGARTSNIVKAATGGIGDIFGNIPSAIGGDAVQSIVDAAGKAGDLSGVSFADEFQKRLGSIINRSPALTGATPLEQSFNKVHQEMLSLFNQKVINPDQAVQDMDKIYAHLKTIRKDFAGSMTPLVDTATQGALADILRLAKDIGTPGQAGGGGGFINSILKLFGKGGGGAGGTIANDIAAAGESGVGGGGAGASSIMPFLAPIVAAIIPYLLSLAGGAVVSILGGIVASGGIASALSSGVLSPLTTEFTKQISEAFKGIGDAFTRSTKQRNISDALSQGLAQAGLPSGANRFLRPQMRGSASAQQAIGQLAYDPSGSLLGQVIKQATQMIRIVGGFLADAMNVLAGPVSSFLSANIKAFQSKAFGEAIHSIVGGFAAILTALTPNISKYMDSFAAALMNLGDAIKANPQAFIQFIDFLNKLIDSVLNLMSLGAQMTSPGKTITTPSGQYQEIQGLYGFPTGMYQKVGAGGGPLGATVKLPGFFNAIHTGLQYLNPMNWFSGNLPSGGLPGAPNTGASVAQAQTQGYYVVQGGQVIPATAQQTAQLTAYTTPGTGKGTIPQSAQQAAQQFVLQNMPSANYLTTFGASMATNITTGLGIGWRGVYNFFNHTVPSNLKGWTRNLPTIVNLGLAGENLMISLLTGIGIGWRGVHDFFTITVWANMTGWFASVGTFLTQNGQDLVTGFLVGIQTGWRDVHNFLDGTIWGNITGWFVNQNTKRYLYQYGQNLAQGLFQGMGDYVSASGGQFIHDNVVVPIAQYIQSDKFGFGIHSPATKMKPVGKQLIQGIVHGMLGEAGKINHFILAVFKDWPHAIATFLSKGWVHAAHLSKGALAQLRKSFSSLGPIGQNVGKALGFIPNVVPAAIGSTVAAYQKYAQSLFSKFGWSSSQMPFLIKLWNQESGWNPRAQNPTSTAYGIAQFLDTTWGPYGPKTADPSRQILYGEEYIKGRYGSPAAAWQHELANNWYDAGGWLPPGVTMAVNMTGKPEAVFTHEQLAQLGSGPEYHAHFDGLTAQAIQAEVRTAFHLMSLHQGAANRQGRRS